MKTWRQSLMSLVSLVSLVSLAGCGEEAPPPVSSAENSAAANNAANNGAPVNNNAAPANNSAAPGPAPLAQVQVSVQPARAVFAPGLRLLPAASVLDAAGAVVEDASITWQVEPPEAATEGEDGRWTLEREGSLRFAGCAQRPGEAAVCGGITLVVDAAAPRVVLLSPEPGAELLAAEHPVIAVTGRVIDTHGTLRAFVNGAPVALEEDGSFTAEVTPRFGINHITVTASDGLQRAEGRAVADVLWAPDYLPPAEAEVAAFTFPDGVSARLGQRFFDDGQPLASPSGEGVVTEDLAELLTLVLARLELLGQVPDPIADQPSLRLRLTALDPGAPRVELGLTDAGLEVFVQLPQLTARTAGQLQIEGEAVPLDGAVYARISGFARVRFAKAGIGAPWEAEVDEVALVLDDAIGVFDDPRASALFDLAESALRTTLEDTLTEAVGSSFLDALPALLRDTLESLEGALDGQVLPIDAGLGAPVTVTLDAELGAVTPDYRAQLVADLTTTVRTDAPRRLAAPTRGAPLREALDAPAPFLRDGRLQLAVRLGLLNGLLHALWSSGLLEVELTELLPPQLASLVRSGSLSAALPPVIAPAEPGEPFALRLTLGQLQLTAEVNGQTDVYGALLSTGISLDFFSGVLQITLHDDPRIETWSIGSSADATFFEGGELAGLLREQVWPLLAEALVQTLTLRLPALDASALVEVAPSLEGLTLDFVLERDVRLRGDFVMFDANLEGRVP
jgi:hypothetical protein